MNQKDFNTLLKQSLKDNFAQEKKRFTVSNDGLLFSKNDKHHGGFHLQCLGGKTALSMKLIFADEEINAFIQSLGIQYPSFTLAMVSIDIWAAKSNSDFSGIYAGIPLPVTDGGARDLIARIIGNIRDAWMPFLLGLIHRDVSGIGFIADFMRKNPRDGFSFPLHICLFIAKQNRLSFAEFAQLIKSTPELSRDLNADLEIARRILS